MVFIVVAGAVDIMAWACTRHPLPRKADLHPWYLFRSPVNLVLGWHWPCGMYHMCVSEPLCTSRFSPCASPPREPAISLDLKTIHTSTVAHRGRSNWREQNQEQALNLIVLRLRRGYCLPPHASKHPKYLRKPERDWVNLVTLPWRTFGASVGRISDRLTVLSEGITSITRIQRNIPWWPSPAKASRWRRWPGDTQHFDSKPRCQQKNIETR